MGQASAGTQTDGPGGAPAACARGGRWVRLRALAAAVLVVAAVGAALAAPAALATTWNLPATDLSAVGGDPDQPQVAVAPDGATTVVWTYFDGTDQRIQARTRPAGASVYGPVQDLTVASPIADQAQIAVAADGTTTVVWKRNDGTLDRIEVRTRSAGASAFGDVETLYTAVGSGDRPMVAVAADGTTTVAWRVSSLAGGIVQARTRPAGASDFGDVQTLSISGENDNLDALAVAADGTTTVVWTRNITGVRYAVQARIRPAGASDFGAVQDVSAPQANASKPAVAVAPDGATTVVWIGYDEDGRNGIVQARTRPVGASAFGASHDLSATGMEPDPPQVVVAPDGATTVVWSQLDQFDPAPGTASVVAATRPAGSDGFGAGQAVGTTGNQWGGPSVGVAPDGAVTAVWGQLVSAHGGDDRYAVQTAARAAGASTFEAAQDLSADTVIPPTAPVAAGPDGAVTVVWVDRVGANNVVRAVSSAPTTYPLSVRRDGTGAGTVTSAPAGIACGATCEAHFTLGGTVTLTAVAASGSTFTGWSGAGCSGTAACTVAITRARSVTATFAGTRPALRVAVSSPTRIRAGRSFTVGVRITNQGPKRAVPARAGRATTTAESLRTCLVVPRNLYVAAAGKGGTVRGRSVCWTRASLAAGTWTSYTATLRSSPYVGGETALRATVTAKGESGVPASASRSKAIRLTDPQAVPGPATPTG